MSTRTIGEARQSQLVTTYGVGSLFPAEDQSYIVMGTEYWPDNSPQLDEPRLARALGVQHFRTPAAGLRSGDVPVMRFPLAHYCPKCHVLGPLPKLQDQQTMWCKRCQKSRLVPSRFIACCDAGHIEDFPYYQWVHQGDESGQDSSDHRLTLRMLGKSSSLSDIVVGCSCGATAKSLSGCFAKHALPPVRRCGGRRPWLETDVVGCDRPLRALQRGSSNVWFGAMRSTISIPPWSTAAASFVDRHWMVLEHLPEGALGPALSRMVENSPGVTVEAVRAVIAQRRGLAARSRMTEAELRHDEYTALCAGTGPGASLDTFICEAQDVGAAIAGTVVQVSAVHRLREVRALAGFSRVTPALPSTDDTGDDLGSGGLSPLSEVPLPWLPAVEVHGEGVFVRLREDLLAEWETTAAARRRAEVITRAQERRDAEAGRPPAPPVAPRALVLHTLAHMLLNELSLHAGYPASALRERLYAAPGQAGILVYTASSDSAGSLGGLAALAQEQVFEEVFRAAVEHGRWCSSDPVCAESRGSGTDNLNLAACHACVLLPETSCELRNVLLDRVCVVGSQEFPDAALFPG